MPRFKITEFDTAPDELTPELRARLEAAGFDLDREVHWLRDQRGVVYFQDDQGDHTAQDRTLSGVEGR